MKVLLVDNHTLFFEGLENLLNSFNIEVAGTIHDITEAVKKARRLEPEAILINITKDRRSWLKDISLFKKELPSALIIVFADNDETLHKAEEHGAAGFLLTAINSGELLAKLRGIEGSKTNNFKAETTK